MFIFVAWYILLHVLCRCTIIYSGILWSHKRGAYMIKKHIKTKNIGAISGPSFAIDLVHKVPVWTL